MGTGVFVWIAGVAVSISATGIVDFVVSVGRILTAFSTSTKVGDAADCGEQETSRKAKTMGTFIKRKIVFISSPLLIKL
jgi:hypothetical protein